MCEYVLKVHEQASANLPTDSKQNGKVPNIRHQILKVLRTSLFMSEISKRI